LAASENSFSESPEEYTFVKIEPL